MNDIWKNSNLYFFHSFEHHRGHRRRTTLRGKHHRDDLQQSEMNILQREILLLNRHRCDHRNHRHIHMRNPWTCAELNGWMNIYQFDRIRCCTTSIDRLNISAHLHASRKTRVHGLASKIVCCGVMDKYKFNKLLFSLIVVVYLSWEKK